MRAFHKYSWLGGAFLFACVSTTVSAQSAAQWKSQQLEASRKSELIMHQAESRKGLLAQYQVMRYAHGKNTDTAFRLIFGQYLSWYQTFIGDYPDASASFSIKQSSAPGDHASPLAEGSYSPRPALEVIPELAKNYRAVFFKEAHNVPLTRTLTVQLLSKLRQEGFNYFAAETLYQADTGLQSRGYPVKNSGFYTEEPIYAEMVRTALRLGFKVVAYEAISDASGDAREKEQAVNLYHEVFQKDPHARLVLDAGYAHIQSSGSVLGGSSMAEHLHELSGIAPLTVEQTVMFPHQVSQDNHPYYDMVIQHDHPTVPTVFVNNEGKPWTLRDGYDISVFFPAQRFESGRPTWVSLGGLRKPFPVSGNRCMHDYPCMVEAHYVDEGPDAIAADILVLDPIPLNATQDDRILFNRSEPSGMLYLRPGKYRLTYTNQKNVVLLEQQIDIPADAPVALPAAASSTGPADT